MGPMDPEINSYRIVDEAEDPPAHPEAGIERCDLPGNRVRLEYMDIK